MRRLLKIVYDLFPNTFAEFLVQDLIGQAPPTVSEPAIEFLAAGKDRLEKWLLFQSYYLQRRAVNDLKNAQLYQGMLMLIKVLLTVTTQAQPKKTMVSTVTFHEEKTGLEEPDKFMQGMKDLHKKKKGAIMGNSTESASGESERQLPKGV